MLEGKTALVTGGSRGIGRAIAIKLAKMGANIVINYTSNEDKAIKVKQEIENFNVKVMIIKADVSKFNEAQDLVKTTNEKFGSLDILVNNAGITKDNLLMRMKEEDFDRVIDVNLKGAFNLIKHASSIMLKQKSGRIINISSVVGVIGNAGQANYAASKAGVIGLTKSAARELASRGITVNAVAPGFINTDMTEKLPEKIKDAMLSNIPLKSFGEASDIANLVGFLSTDEAKYITGQVINVDGGMVM
ncbi:MAG: 3-oxoacyl-[acyl-carrier-protein] reductase [Clostridiaceae bacterium]